MWKILLLLVFGIGTGALFAKFSSNSEMPKNEVQVEMAKGEKLEAQNRNPAAKSDIHHNEEKIPFADSESEKKLEKIPFSQIDAYVKSKRESLWAKQEETLPLSFTVNYTGDQEIRSMSGSSSDPANDLLENRNRYQFYEGELDLSEIKMPRIPVSMKTPRDPKDGSVDCAMNFHFEDKTDSNYCDPIAKNTTGQMIVSYFYGFDERFKNLKVPYLGARMKVDFQTLQAQLVGYHFHHNRWLPIGEIHWKRSTVESFIRLNFQKETSER